MGPLLYSVAWSRRTSRQTLAARMNAKMLSGKLCQWRSSEKLIGNTGLRKTQDHQSQLLQLAGTRLGTRPRQQARHQGASHPCRTIGESINDESGAGAPTANPLHYHHHL